MTSDVRPFLARDLRTHPRVAYQGLIADPDAAARIAAELPPMPPMQGEYYGALSVVDWDHRLPSQALALRIYAYYTEESFAAGQEAYDDRLEEIGRQDRYPEFDVPDFDSLPADEAYEIELDPAGAIGRCRLTSAWRRQIDRDHGIEAVRVARAAPEYQRLIESGAKRPAHLGDLEAVSWTPPCESQHARWTLDVWYLLAFDGRVGTGRSFLVDLDAGEVISVRDFSVRTA